MNCYSSGDRSLTRSIFKKRRAFELVPGRKENLEVLLTSRVRVIDSDCKRRLYGKKQSRSTVIS